MLPAVLHRHSGLTLAGHERPRCADPDPTKPVPVKLEIVAYRPSQDPSNRDVILTLASNPAGLQLDTVDTIGSKLGRHSLCNKAVSTGQNS